MMRKLIAACSFAALAAALTAPAVRAADEKKTIAEIFAGSKDHTVLAGLVKEAGLTEVLSSKGDHTVFAPTDAAFKKLDKAALEKVKGDKELLKKVLLSHAVKGAVTAGDVARLNGKELETLSGATFKVAVKEKLLMIGDAKVSTGISASNGVIHVIDTVLMPTK